MMMVYSYSLHNEHGVADIRACRKGIGIFASGRPEPDAGHHGSGHRRSSAEFVFCVSRPIFISLPSSLRLLGGVSGGEPSSRQYRDGQTILLASSRKK